MSDDVYLWNIIISLQKVPVPVPVLLKPGSITNKISLGRNSARIRTSVVITPILSDGRISCRTDAYLVGRTSILSDGRVGALAMAQRRLEIVFMAIGAEEEYQDWVC